MNGTGAKARESAMSDVSTCGRTVVIVGAGFCGPVLAINLLRTARGEPLKVVLVDRAQMARGVAYARRPFRYLPNVPAGRMSARAAEPLEFLHFAQRHPSHVSADDFLPRQLYGAYLESALAGAEQTSPPRVCLERVYGSAIAIERPHRGALLEVHLADGRTLNADAVVLACGNPAPAPLPGAHRLRGTSRYVADPRGYTARDPCRRDGADRRHGTDDGGRGTGR